MRGWMPETKRLPVAALPGTLGRNRRAGSLHFRVKTKPPFCLAVAKAGMPAIIATYGISKSYPYIRHRRSNRSRGRPRPGARRTGEARLS